MSAHRSEEVMQWLEAANIRASQPGHPRFEVFPLPSNAQFLNVIEAIFSGLRRAVIHNSDYPSQDDMEAAITRHFEERNAYYKLNPKRVGNKIWDKEIFKIEELPGGLFRRM